MKSFAIEMAFNRLQSSIKNTAIYYEEGRNILIYCLSRNSDTTEKEVVKWLKDNKILIKNLEEYKIRNDSDRIK